ncbi:MAG: aminotransferase class I/II-fold pyridoxal phosphate-dependent enzyme [Planctomycetota bacterium]
MSTQATMQPSDQDPDSSSNSEERGKKSLDVSKKGFSTISVHGGEGRSKPCDAITDSIVCSSTYTFEDSQSIIDFIENDEKREEYGRYGNPNEKVVEAKLAALDGGEHSIVYSSGMAAIVGLFMTKLSAGDEIVFFDQCYHRSREFCYKHLSRYGVVTHQVPTGDIDAMDAAINDRTKLLVSESPTNPQLTCVDLEQFVALAKEREVETLIDATLATPFNVKPLDFGVDYVLHSATKYLGGHNDLLAGCLTGSADKLEEVRKLRGIMGGVNSPHNLYLLQRGLKTFELRMQRHNENGQALAEFLHDHPRVEHVFYPGLKSHPTHATAARNMSGFGGLVTFLLKGADWRETAAVVDKVEIAKIGPSLGGVETLIEQPLLMSYYQETPENRKKFGIPDNMIRLACGIENTDDLIRDLKQALEK